MPFERHLGVVSNPACPIKLKVAFASGDHQHVDQHFGHSGGFVLYTIDEQSHCHLSDIITFDDEPSPQPEAVHDSNKLHRKLTALEGCDAIYCIACGPSAIRQLLGQNIQPIKVDSGTPIKYLLHQLVEEMKHPAGWVARALRRQHKSQIPPWQVSDFY